MKLFVSPHNDDAGLFGSFTIQARSPLVVTLLDSFVQVNRGHWMCDAKTRRKEDEAAMKVLGCRIEFAKIRDDLQEPAMREQITQFLSRFNPDEVWIPAVEDGGHEHHNLIGGISEAIFRGTTVHKYLTYTPRGKSTNGSIVPANGTMVLKKLQALACYKTQIEVDALGCWPHFLRDQNEYIQA